MGNRVKYNKSPLVEVIYQLRFPTILSINSNQPIDFQEAIREEYPFFEQMVQPEQQIKFSAEGIPPEIRIKPVSNYQFITEDGNNKINLTSSYIAFSTLNYSQWENFIGEIDRLIPIFEEIYAPRFYTRIGVRYKDVITRSKLGLDDRKWNELLQPHILGIMTRDVEDGINSFVMESEYHNDKSNTNTKTHFELVRVNDERVTSFLIDCDYFYGENCSVQERKTISELLHEQSNSFIRNAITDELHNAMEPEDI